MKNRVLDILGRLAFWSSVVLLSNSVSAQRQSSLYTEKNRTVTISGINFVVLLDDSSKTATLENNGNYKIDTRPYAIYKSRKFENMDESRTLVIPSTVTFGDTEYTVTALGKAVFAGYQNIDNVEIPSTVKRIDNYAFFFTSLKEVLIPFSVESLGIRVFGACNKLKTITLPNPQMASKDLYAESKNIDVRFMQFGEVPSSNKGEKGTSDPVFALTSDVDEDIPVSEVENDETFAVIIANEIYKKEEPVYCAHRDGSTFKRYCEKTLGIPAVNIHYVQDATLANIIEEINWLSRVVKAYEGDAKVILYYAGHGIPDESRKTAHLLPVDGTHKNMHTCYSLNELYSTLGSLPSKAITVFLDACFSGAQRGVGMIANNRAVAIKVKHEDPLGKMVVFSAAQGDETAYPYAEKGHGLFTYFLLKKLKDTNGDVDFGTLSSYLRKEVVRKAAVVNNKPQTPSVSYSAEMADTWQKLKLK